MNKQDMTHPRTPSDLDRRYGLGRQKQTFQQTMSQAVQAAGNANIAADRVDESITESDRAILEAKKAAQEAGDAAALARRQAEEAKKAATEASTAVREANTAIEEAKTAAKTANDAAAAISGKIAGKLDKPAEPPLVGQILKIKTVNPDGSFVAEWANAGV